MDHQRSGRHRVVIIGAGFAGLTLARHLRRAPVDVTVIDSSNHHLFQPLLYQVATGALSPGDIASPTRSILRRHRNTRIVKGTVTAIDPGNRTITAGDQDVGYDTLVIAAGLSTHYFGNAQWEKHARGLKSLNDAVAIRKSILDSFEAAENSTDEKEQRRLLTTVIVGAGPTGVETAGAVAELSRHTLRHDFRAIDTRRARIILVEGADRILPTFHARLSTKALASMERMGVEVRLATRVTDIQDQQVEIQSRDGTEKIEAATVVWSAGVRGAAIGDSVSEAFGIELDRHGRVPVLPDLRLSADSDVFVAGDLAHLPVDGKDVPLVAPAAMQQGRYIARAIRRRLAGRPAKPGFSYFDKGSLAVIGRNRAVVQVGRIRASGFPAWLIWIVIHITFLVEFDNRLLVMIQWAWTYFTRRRGARLIL